MKIDSVVEDVKSKFKHIFNKTFSDPIVGYEADLVLKEDRPIFRKAYEVPLRLKQKVIEHLDSLEKDGVITPVEVSEWASPVVVVMKKDHGIRLVIDCRVSINKVITPNTYPLPVAQDLFASLSGAKVFCSLDLAGAYTQLRLSKRSRKFMIINTLKGLYCYNRLPQGASSSASIFQRVMDQILKGLPMVFCYLDDVLIAGVDFEDCQRKLYLVLERLAKANIKVNLKKCKFFVHTLPYLGHVITDKGLMPCPEKVQTIRDAKSPQNVTELKAFLGLLNFYGKFIPHLSSHLSCLYNLLKKDTRFLWSENCQNTFNFCKTKLLNSNLLEYFDPDKPIVVVSDACNYGLGGVIAHVVNGIEKPISFTSFSLNKAQQSYPIIHLEALAVVSTVKKFHKFLYGKKFTVYTDHKPLIGIFGKEGRNALYATRLQRYVLELSIYEFDIVYRPSTRMGNADFCSRFPLSTEVPKYLQREFIKRLNMSSSIPIDYRRIAKETELDDFLQQIKTFLRKGWPERLDKRFKDVHAHYLDLEEVDGCMLFQDRVIIPVALKRNVLEILHQNHVGIAKIKQLARRSVYWFGLNRDIEDFVRACKICNQMAIVHKKAPIEGWIPTSRPFSRIHADFFYFQQKVFLLIIDSYSKWLELDHMKYGTDGKKVIAKFMAVFARFGLPDVVVTDGGPPFNSHSFIKFLENQGVKVLKSPPYNPQSNGQAERMVRLVKEVFKKFLLDPQIQNYDTEERVNLFLFNYRNTCLNDNGHFPSEKLFIFKPKTILDLLNPKNDYKRKLTKPLHDVNRTKSSTDKQVQDPLAILTVGDPIYYKNTNPTDIKRWIIAKFIKRLSTNVFQISLGGRLVSAHRHQLRLAEGKHRTRASVIFDDFPPVRLSKRRREDDDINQHNAKQRNKQNDEDFYGFVSDSFIFDGFDSSEETIETRKSQVPVEVEHGQQKNCLSSDQKSLPNIRRSSRLKVKKKDKNFVYQ
ncbi:uncharacterized protein K02A2.6-like isoform X1 [Malaya genurostris]|uniref:uncharacterized protein K02A2.6-like isoform X1 n=1 Tax=Malaya genurostris TaxID=325434 RepID=UPI0026F383C6|nr:uncharacterized protein K02A2.6-like isoform X1 [Malaya genurostris]